MKRTVSPLTLMRLLQVVKKVGRQPLSFAMGEGKFLNIYLYVRVNF